MTARFSTIGDLLRNNESIRELLARRERECALLIQVRDRLPQSLRAHCLDVSVAERRLTVFFDSPAWTTRARFLAADLAASLTAQRFDDIRIQIRPNCDAERKQTPDRTTDPYPTGAPPRRLTPDTVQHLLAAADQIFDPDLSCALRRLANRHAPPAPSEREPGRRD